MNTFNEGQHPRGQAGKFTTKTKAGAGVSLDSGDSKPAEQYGVRPVPATVSELQPGDEIWYLDGNQIVDRTEHVTDQDTGRPMVALYARGADAPRMHAPASPVLLVRPETPDDGPAVIPAPTRQNITIGQVGQIGEIELLGTIEDDEPYTSVWLRDAQMRQLARAADAWREDDPSANSSCRTLFLDEEGAWWQDSHTGPASGPRYQRLSCRLDEHGRRRYCLEDWGFSAADEDED